MDLRLDMSFTEVVEEMISIAEKRPEIVSEWSPRNGMLTPFNTPYGSGKKVVWRCKEGHEWVTSVRSRTQGNNCPVCSGKKVLKGFNDLQTLYPELAVEWSEKNDPLQPSVFSAMLDNAFCLIIHDVHPLYL